MRSIVIAAFFADIKSACRTKRLVIAVIVAGLTCGFFNCPAYAQSTPVADTTNGPVIDGPNPPHVAQDRNSIDFVSGNLFSAEKEVSIGDTEHGGLARIYYFSPIYTDQNADNNLGQLDNTGSDYCEPCGGITAIFHLGSTSYSFAGEQQNPRAREDEAVSYSYSNSSSYSLTLKDGSVATYNLPGNVNTDSNGFSLITKLVKPDGETLNYFYKPVSFQVQQGDRTTSSNLMRLQGISNNLGYVIKYSYQSSNGSADSKTLVKVQAINTAIDYCDPSADTCSGLTMQWPTVSLSFTGTPVNNGATALSVTDLLSRQTTYRYNSNGYSANNGVSFNMITRPSGRTTSATMDMQGGGQPMEGAVASISTATGTWTYTRTWGFASYGGLNPVQTIVKDPVGKTKTVSIDVDTREINNITDELGYGTSYSEGSFYSRINTITPPAGFTSAYQYDARGNITQQSRNNVAIYTASYGTTCANTKTCNKPLWTRDGNGNETDYTYDPSSGFVTSVIRPANASGVRSEVDYAYTALYAWYKNGSGALSQASTPVWRLTSIRNCANAQTCPGTANSQVQTFTYGVAGIANNLMLTGIRSALGDGSTLRQTSIAYDAIGNKVSETKPSGAITYYRYDAVRQLVGQVEQDPDGSGPLPSPATRYTYDPDGNVTLTELGTVTDTSDAAWSNFTLATWTSVTYDSSGRKSLVETGSSGSAAATATQYSYDAVDRLQCTAVRMNPSIYNNLPSSACTLGTQGSQGQDRITQNIYDAASQVLKVIKGYGTSVQTTDATYTYSPTGKQSSVTDANGNLATLAYDSFDRLQKWSFPSPTTAGQVNANDYETYSYDANDNLTSLRKRDGRTFTFNFDALNRIASKIVPDGCAPIQVGPCTPDTATRDVYYAYDLRGLQTDARFDSLGGDGSHNLYDGFGQLTQMSTTLMGINVTLTFVFDVDGNRTGIIYPDGSKFTYAYDGLDRNTLITDPSGTSISNTGYTNLGYVSAVNKQGPTTFYGYDGIGRLNYQGQSLPNPSALNVNLSYNPAGQVISTSSDNDAFAFTGYYNVNRDYTKNGLNQYTTAGSATFSYDAVGSLISDGTNNYAYDAETRLIGASGGHSATLAYDPQGRLFSITSGTILTRFLYDGDKLIAEYDGNGNLLRRFIHGDSVDTPLVWYEGAGLGDRRSMFADHENSIIATTNSAGNPITIDSYDEYGIPGANNAGRFQYTGQAWISELGMYYYKARMYSPTLGRFMQTDPVGYKDQINLYAYVANDPVNRNDPTGNESGCITLNTGCGMSSSGNGVTLGGAIEAASYILGGLEITGGGGPEDPIGDAAAAATVRGGRALSAEVRAAERGVGPGPYARESVPAGPGRRPSTSQQSEINRMGGEHGCHTCGTRQPGTKSGNFIGDHQPPTKLNPPGGSQQYYPHCQGCSNVQGGRLSQMPRTETPPPPPPTPTKSWWKF